MGANQRLQAYLDALCDHWPEDYEYYVIGNEKQQLCVFCEEYHSDYAVHVRDIYSGTIKKSTGTYACTNCAQHVEALIAREWNIGSYAKDSFDSSDEIDRHENTSETRKNLLAMDLQFAADTFRHYTYLRGNRDKYVANSENNRCYICGDFNKGHPVTGSNSWLQIEHPVEYDGQLTGGPILICPSCEFYIADVHDHYTEKVLKKTLFQYKCPKCQLKYYVSQGEQSYRKDCTSGSLLDPEWLCPSCTYEKIDAEEEGIAITFTEHNAAPRYEPITRFVNRMCYTCLRSEVFDLMLTPSSFHNRHVIEGVSDKVLMCGECAEQGLKALFISKNVVAYNPRILVVLHTGNTYEVLRLKSEPTYPEQVLQGKVFGRSVVDKICEVFNAVDNLYLMGEL